MMTDLEILKAARELITSPARWTQFFMLAGLLTGLLGIKFPTLEFWIVSALIYGAFLLGRFVQQ